MRLLSILIAAAILGAPALVTPALAHADVVSGCQEDNWGFLGLTQKRDICDGVRYPDGTWTRARVIRTPAAFFNPSSSCSGGLYYSNCTYDPGGYRPQTIQESTTYVVADDNVPFGEPPYLINGVRL